MSEQLRVVEESSLYTTAKAIEAAIDTAHSQSGVLQVEYHKIACSVIVHLGKNFDIRIYNRLISNMPECLRTDSMQAFFDKYSVVAFDDEGEASIDKSKGTRLGDALVSPWWKAKKPTAYVPYNFVQACEKLLATASTKAKKAEKLASNGKPVQDAVTHAQVNAFASFVQSMKKEPGQEAQEQAAA